MKNSKKIDYYFRVKTDTKYYYSCVKSESYDKAKRRLLFACFSYKMDDGPVPFKSQFPATEDRYEVLNQLYSNRIEDSTKAVYDKKDRYQND